MRDPQYYVHGKQRALYLLMLAREHRIVAYLSVFALLFLIEEYPFFM